MDACSRGCGMAQRREASEKKPAGISARWFFL
jgi:hypothetical protein